MPTSIKRQIARLIVQNIFQELGCVNYFSRSLRSDTDNSIVFRVYGMSIWTGHKDSPILLRIPWTSYSGQTYPIQSVGCGSALVLYECHLISIDFP